MQYSSIDFAFSIQKNPTSSCITLNVLSLTKKTSISKNFRRKPSSPQLENPDNFFPSPLPSFINHRHFSNGTHHPLYPPPWANSNIAWGGGNDGWTTHRARACVCAGVEQNEQKKTPVQFFVSIAFRVFHLWFFFSSLSLDIFFFFKVLSQTPRR